MSINHIPELTCYPGAQNEFTVADTWVIDSYVPGEWDGTSGPGNLVYFYSDTSGQQTTIDISAFGDVYVSYVSFQDVNFVGGTIHADSGTCVGIDANNSGIFWSATSKSDLEAYLDVVDFSIPSVSSPILNADYTKVTLTYTGVATPTNTDVNLTSYQYSLDGTTWDPMTVASGSVISGLTFSPTGNSYPFIWSIRYDIGTNIYNIPIQVRFQATATFSSNTVSTSYKYVSVYLAKTLTITELVTQSVFSPEYSGTAGYSLMKNAPKVMD